MYNRLINFFSQNDFFNHSPVWIARKHSTYMTILYLLDTISHQIDSKNDSLGIILDLSKAFDTINHKVFLNKVDHCGIRGIALKWFMSFR